MTVSQVLGHLAEGFEVLGAAILVLGFAWAVVASARRWRRTGSQRQAYDALRRSFASALLLSLEILVAEDLIRTVAVHPDLANIAVLGLIVLIRTFLSFALTLEVEGRFPWQPHVELPEVEVGPGRPGPGRPVGGH